MGSVPPRIVCDGGGARAIDAGTSELNFEEPTGDGMDLPLSLDSTSWSSRIRFKYLSKMK